MKVGIFDSGNGGLSVLLEALKQLPEAEFIFYGDTTHVPYGEKTEALIRDYVDEAMDFMIRHEVDAVVLACNTATSVAAEHVRQKYRIPVIGMEPAAKKALDYNDEKRTLVIATPVTVRGKKLQGLIGRYDKHHLVDIHAMPGLVGFAEAGNYDSDEVSSYLKEELGSYPWENYASLVLGCTHFNYFKKELHSLIPPHVIFLDGNEGTVKQLKRMLASLFPDKDFTPSEDLQPFDIQKALNRVDAYYSGKRVSSAEEMEALAKRLGWLDQMWAIR